MPLSPPPPPPPGGPRAQWREAQRLRLAGACLFASAVLVASCGAAAFLMASVSLILSSKFSLSAALWTSLLSPRVALAALLMSAAQALAVVATGNAARACPPLGPRALSFVPRGGRGRRRHRQRWLSASASAALSAADAALTRLFLDGAASSRSSLALLAGCAASGWVIVPLFCWMAQGCVDVGGSPSPSPSSCPPTLSTPSWAPTLGLLAGTAHALLHLGLGDDVVLVPALRRARAFAVKRAAAECVRRAVLTSAVAAAALSLAAGGGGGGADAASLASAAAASSPASTAVSLLGAALAAHALLVGAASVRAAFSERTQFVDSGSSRTSISTSSSSFRVAQQVSAAAGAMASANDGLVASIVEASSSSSSRRRDFSSSPLEASLFDLAVRADAMALAEASAGSSGAWRRAALFADGVGVGNDSSIGRSGDGYGESSNNPFFPGAFPGRAWSAVVGGLCLSELAPALAAVGAALLPAAGSTTTAAGVPPSTSGRGGGAAAPAASGASPPRWNERPSAAATARAGASSVFFAAAKRLASAATSLLSNSSSSSKPSPPSSSTETPLPLPPAVLKAKAAALLRQRWQHLALALRTLGALSAAAAEEDAAGVAQLAGNGGRSGGSEGVDPTSFQFSFHPGTDLGSVLSALLSAAVAFGAAAEPGALPEGTAAGTGSGGSCSAAFPPPGLGKLAAALEEEEDAGLLHSSSSSSPPLRRDAAASALADVALAAAHQAVSRYGKDARRALLSAQLAAPIFGSGVSAAAVAALAEAVLAGRD